MNGQQIHGQMLSEEEVRRVIKCINEDIWLRLPDIVRRGSRWKIAFQSGGKEGELPKVEVSEYAN